MFLIIRGVEGDPRPLSVGALSLPPTVPWSLRLRKFQTRLNHVQPLDFVSFANYTSQNNGADSGGALLFSVFVVSNDCLQTIFLAGPRLHTDRCRAGQPFRRGAGGVLSRVHGAQRAGIRVAGADALHRHGMPPSPAAFSPVAELATARRTRRTITTRRTISTTSRRHSTRRTPG